MMAINRIINFNKQASIAPLVTFRVTFGLLMFYSLLRFWWRGWVTTTYIEPKFHFTYMGFGWVKALGSVGMHLLIILILISALMIALGFLYRIAAVSFFLSFTYLELIDVTTYLNHYYFISLIAFLLIWLPAGKANSIDILLRPHKKRLTVPRWTIDILRFQVAIVYIFAGLAKLNADWLFHAEPMRTWLPSKSHLPVIGHLMYEEWVAYLFSWFGAAYDLFIAFFLLNKKTRQIAYCFVLVFHIATAIFFPAIGMFPYIMIMSSLIFFSGSFHRGLQQILSSTKKTNKAALMPYHFKYKKLMLLMLALYVFVQIILPLRFLLYPGHMFWHEEGYRFSWRVMLMEKSGAAYFTVKDKTGEQFFEVNNKEFLTPLQEKMMSTQPDMILKYAHFLATTYKKRGIDQPKVFAEIYVTLNGRPSTLFVDSTVNLAAEPLSWKHYKWVLPYKN